MFCKYCGTELSDTAKFCHKCGNALGEVQEKKIETVKENVLKLNLVPTFKFSYKFFNNFFKVLGMVFFMIFYISVEFFYIFDKNIKNVYLIAFAAVLVISLIKTFIDKLQYDKLEYKFYTDYIEYKDGFVNKEEKELKYKYVREITMSRGIIERIFGLGTINIFTNASSGYYNGRNNHGGMNTRNGIHIHCVANVNEEYRKIRQIIDESTENEEK
ncbi:MAG: PH domain-containing protein [Clostridia bacterium]|nr:PH domain-containing protein [Clostridia bacterium]